MNISQRLIDAGKKIYSSVRVAKVHPTLVWGARILILIMLTPIILSTIAFAQSFAAGYVSDANEKLINMGTYLIDHMYGQPGVVISLTALLAIGIDRDGDGLPDKLEETQKNDNKTPMTLERGITNDRDNSTGPK